MNIKQIILIAATFLALVGLYLFGKTKNPKKAYEPPKQPAQEQVFDMREYLRLAKQNLTSTDTLALIVAAENEFKRLSETTQRSEKVAAAEHLSALHAAVGDPLGSAYYYQQAAVLANDAGRWHRAGENFLSLAGVVSVPATRDYLYQAAITSFERASELESDNLSHKVKLGTAYVEQGSNPMQGISILLDVVKQDSTYAEAQFALGKFSMLSGQFEKAISRLEKVLHSQPQNTEVLFLLAEAYRNTGNNQKAVEYFEKCKKQVDDPALKKEIDRLIEITKSK
jgi:tetratricopeptide (TPR) repeat protein